MKRLLSLILIYIIALYSSAPFVYADESKYTSGSEYNTSADYATREQAISRFIKTVGISRFSTDHKILDKFRDSSKISYPYTDEMSAAVYSGLINGYEDGTLRPQESITRIEALVILNRALSHTDLSSRYNIQFSDTPDWASKQVTRLASAGIIKGYGDGRLGADDFLTPEQVDLICDRISHFAGPSGDFYTYVNSQWLDSNAPLNGLGIISDNVNLSAQSVNRISDIIFSLYRRHYNNGENFAEDSDESRIISFYSAAANQALRDKIGFSPIAGYLSDIDEIKTSDELLSVMARLEKCGFVTLMPLTLTTNVYDSSSYTLSLSACYVGLSKEYRTGSSAEENRNYYIEYIAKLLELSGDPSPVKTAEMAADVCRDISSGNNGGSDNKSAEVLSISDFAKLTPETDIKKYLKNLGFDKAKTVMLYNKAYPVLASKYMTDKSLDCAKAYLKASVLDTTAEYLTTESFNARQQFHNKLDGTNFNYIPSDYAIELVSKTMGWELGKMYVDTYLPEYTKAAIEEMTQKIIDKYEELINSCTRMNPQTRANAVKKLKSIKINAAAPDDFDSCINRSYHMRPVEDGGNLMEYMIECAKSVHLRDENRLNSGKKAVRNTWSLYPQDVNAMYDPQTNCITIPAGILQQPYFDLNASYEENLGGIGTVIAHEISHAFDSIGSAFDENGSLKSWWTENDRMAFAALCEKTINEYDGLSVGKGRVDGKLTLNENLSDIAGMSCMLSLVGSDESALERFFCSYAKIWRTNMSDDTAAFMLANDVHAPSKIRVNRVLSNFDIFINHYGIKEGDGMYIPPEKRINFWK